MDGEVRKTIWNKRIKGILTEVVFWTNDNMVKPENRHIYPQKGIWNAYVIIYIENLPNDFTKLLAPCTQDERGRVIAHYYSAGIGRYFNFHYGITYYKKLFNNLGMLTGVKIGCDYNHLHDDEFMYRYEDIERDLIENVNTFIENFLDYHIWCAGNGKYYKPEEMEERNGYWYSKEYSGDCDYQTPEDSRFTQIGDFPAKTRVGECLSKEIK